MAALTCQICGAVVLPSDLICPECGSNLTRAPTGSSTAGAAATQEGPLSRAAAAPSGEPGIPPEESERCPHCGTPIPDPSNLVCIECLSPLRADAGAMGLRLAFGSWDITVPAGGSVLLGRDIASPAAAGLSQHDNVSRRHATVTVTRAGQASISDEHSTNGTFVNGQRAVPGRPVPLRNGDTLRLASDVTATVQFSSYHQP